LRSNRTHENTPCNFTYLNIRPANAVPKIGTSRISKTTTRFQRTASRNVNGVELTDIEGRARVRAPH
jgi:hypothetical protein